MKNKLYTAIGLMSGTSMDGVDVSLIRSDGFNQFTNILDEYFEYNEILYRELIELRNLITNVNDLKEHSSRLNKLEREITVFHSKIVSNLSFKYEDESDYVGFHGQTIFHNPEQKITKQLGDGRLMSQLVKKKVIYDFRQEDIANKGQGAPLTPIFHNLLSGIINEKHQINFPICFLNIGGISNITKIIKKDEKLEAIGDYLTRTGLKSTVTEDPRGFYYKIVSAGTGTAPSLTSKVTLFYKGYLTNGNVFDQTGTTANHESGNPVTFTYTVTPTPTRQQDARQHFIIMIFLSP